MSTSQKRMPKRRMSKEELTTAIWPEPQIDGWSPQDVRRYNNFKFAILDYLHGEKVKSVEGKYRITLSQIQEQIWRACQRDANGELIGFRALIPRLQVCATIRKLSPPSGMYPVASRCTGAFQQLLAKENLVGYIEDYVLKRRSGPNHARLSILTLQKELCHILTERGYKQTDYPFNTRRPLYSSLVTLVDAIHSAHMEEFVRANESDTAATNLSVQRGQSFRASRPCPFEEVEVDEHKLHGIGTVIVTIDGIDKYIPAERPVGIAIIDRGSGAILGASVCLSPEAKEGALIEAMRTAVIPDYEILLPSGKAAPKFRPSDFYPELGGAIWTTTFLDNARIHTGNRYQSGAAHLGTFSCFGPLASWSSRPNIERAFRDLVHSHFSLLPSTTGSRPHFDGKRVPSEEAIRNGITMDDLCEQFYLGLARINKHEGEGELFQAPIDVIRNYVKGKGKPILRTLPPTTATQPEFGEQVRRLRVCRRGKDNPNMYVNFCSVKYSNEVLARRVDLHGEYILVHVGSNIRTLKAFEITGQLLGVLTADGIWGKGDHTVEVRRAIFQDKNKQFGNAGTPKPDLRDLLERKAVQLVKKNSRRKKGGIVKGALELGRLMASTSTPHLEIESNRHEQENIVTAVTAGHAAQRARIAREAASKQEDNV